MSDVALEVLLGIVFAILGIGMVLRSKNLTKSKYYRYLFIIIGIIMVGFAVYLAVEALSK